MTTLDNIREHMEVVGSCGKHVGTVDHLDGPDQIKLTRKDENAGGEHHWIPVSWVESVGETVKLNKDCDAAMREWKSESAGKA